MNDMNWDPGLLEGNASYQLKMMGVLELYKPSIQWFLPFYDVIYSCKNPSKSVYPFSIQHDPCMCTHTLAYSHKHMPTHSKLWTILEFMIDLLKYIHGFLIKTLL